MNESTFFSIITPCYNSEKTIERTIQSVLNQTCQSFRYYIVDGGSTDGTVSIIQRYVELYPNKIRYISEKDNGIYDGINKGIRMAIDDSPSQLIGIVNSDDFYEMDALQHMAEAYTKTDIGNFGYVVLYGALRIWEKGKEKSIWLNRHEFLPSTMIGHPACFVSEKLYRDKGMYSLNYRSAADYEFMLRMFNDEQVRFQPVYHVISNFSTGGFSDSKLGDHETKKLKYQFGYLSKIAYFLHLMSYYVRFWRH